MKERSYTETDETEESVRLARVRKDPRLAKSASELSFRDLDVNGDGVLSAEELRPVAHLINISTADLNGDGVVNNREFALARGFQMDRENDEKRLDRRATADTRHREHAAQRERVRNQERDFDDER
jgi:hypothetical protein